MRVSLSVLLASMVLFTHSAAAERAKMGSESPWISFGLAFGFSGEMGFGASIDGNDSSSTSRANPTAGFVINGGLPLLPHLKLGGQLGFHWLQSESMDKNNTDRNFAFDLQLLIRPYLTVLGGKVEFFLDVTQGLTVMAHDAERFTTTSGGLSVAPEFGNAVPIVPGTFIGWSGQVLVGAEYHFLDYLSAHLKFGYTGWYAVANDENNDAVKASVQSHQFALILGSSYKF